MKYWETAGMHYKMLHLGDTVSDVLHGFWFNSYKNIVRRADPEEFKDAAWSRKVRCAGYAGLLLVGVVGTAKADGVEQIAAASLMVGSAMGYVSSYVKARFLSFGPSEESMQAKAEHDAQWDKDVASIRETLGGLAASDVEHGSYSDDTTNLDDAYERAKERTFERLKELPDYNP